MKKNFKTHVYDIVGGIPKGRVMTYGQIAALAGNPRAARIVGGIAHRGDTRLPWQRVVKKDGSLAEGYPGGIEGHRKHLLADGVRIDKTCRVNVKEYQWLP